jgi:hypothetical protein
MILGKREQGLLLSLWRRLTGKPSRALLALLTVVALGGCHGGGHFGSRVDVVVEVTAPSGPVGFVVTVSSVDQDNIDVSATTPFRTEFAGRRLPVDVSVRRVTGSGIPLILCVTNVTSGRQRCRQSTAPSVVVGVP